MAHPNWCEGLSECREDERWCAPLQVRRYAGAPQSRLTELQQRGQGTLNMRSQSRLKELQQSGLTLRSHFGEIFSVRDQLDLLQKNGQKLPWDVKGKELSQDLESELDRQAWQLNQNKTEKPDTEEDEPPRPPKPTEWPIPSKLLVASRRTN